MLPSDGVAHLGEREWLIGERGDGSLVREGMAWLIGERGGCSLVREGVAHW